MNAVSAALLLIAAVPAWVAGLHLWTYLLRRQDRHHLWLAVASLGGLAIAIPSALIPTSETVEQATLYRSAMTWGSLPFYLGILRFTEAFLGVTLRRTEAIALPAIVASGILTLVQGPVIGSDAVVRHLAGLDATYIDVAPAPAMAGIGIGFFVVVWIVVVQYLRATFSDRGEALPLAAAAIGFLAATTSDVLVGMGVLDLPFLTAVAQTGLLVALTMVLSRRYVQSAISVERATAALQAAAEERASALQQKDLQLAHDEALATVGTLAAGLAHEINNPIAFISANLNHLGELRSEEGSEAEIHEVLEETREGIERVRSIVDELTRLSRRGDGRDERVDLSRVVESVLPIVRHEARARVRIETHLEDVPPVRGDRQLLGQVVLNLVLNAVHAAEAPGDEGRVVIATTSERGTVSLHVHDSGPGIPDSVRPRIFEPFYTTKGEGQGTGLGLAITKQLVERHGGEIGVETGEQGTRMTVAFPAIRITANALGTVREALVGRT